MGMQWSDQLQKGGRMERHTRLGPIKVIHTLRLRIADLDLPDSHVATDASTSQYHNGACTASINGKGHALVVWLEMHRHTQSVSAEMDSARRALSYYDDGSTVHLHTDCQEVEDTLTGNRRHYGAAFGRGLQAQASRLNVIVQNHGRRSVKRTSNHVPLHALLSVAHRLAYAGLLGYQTDILEHPLFPEVLQGLALRGGQNARIKEIFRGTCNGLGIPTK